MGPSALRVVVVGYGPRGRQWADRVQARGDVEVAGVVDPDASACDAARRSGLRTWSALPIALADAAPTAVVVASPPPCHIADARAAVQAGVAALVEKPLALSTADAVAIAAEAAHSAVRVLVAQNFRYLPRELAVRDALRAGRVGAPTAIAIDSARAASVAPRHLSTMPNGCLWDFCLHHLDALRVRFGRPPDAVEAEVDDGSVRARLAWPGCDVVYRHSDRTAGYHYRERLEGSAGTILVDDRHVRLVGPGHGHAHSRGRGLKASHPATPEDAILAELVAAVRDGPRSTLEASDNVETIAIVESLIEAAHSGRRVAVSELLPASRGR